MTTKNTDGFLLLSKNQIFVNSIGNDSQYSNLNLNQNQKISSDAFLISSQSKLSNDKRLQQFLNRSDLIQNYQKDEKVLWNKSLTDEFSSKPFESLNLLNNQNKESEDRKKRMKGYSSINGNSSTLSLHIAAYENSIEAQNSDDSKDDASKPSKNLMNLSTKVQNPFELPRQNNNNDENKKPEIMQYKASQKLLSPDKNGSKKKSGNNNTTDESTSTTTSQEKPTRLKAGWRRFIAKFRRKPKPSSESTLQTTATTQQSSSPFDMPQESDAAAAGGGLCVKKKKNNNDEIAVEANTSWRRLRKVRSLEGPGNSGKSSKKIPKAKRQSRTKKKKGPSKESIDEPTVFDDQTQEQTQEQTIGDASTKTSPKQQKEDELDQSRKISRKKTPSKEGDDLSISKSVQRGFRNFRDKRAKNFRTVKTFISRATNKKAMEKVVAEVEARKQRRTTDPSQDSASNASTASTKLHHGDDIFPQRRPNKKSNQFKPSPDPNNNNNNNNAPAKHYTKHETTVDSNGLVLIETNNCNDGKLFLPNGRPFWQQNGKGKPGEPDDDDELTDDELPMNAEVILDVHRGKIKLTDMPTTTVVLDPYGPTAALEEHDNNFFTRDLIFSNTVRSMINLNDELADHSMPKLSAERRCQFENPHQIHRYTKVQPDEFQTEHFKPKNSERM